MFKFSYKSRLAFVFLTILTVFLILLGQLLYLQVFKSNSLRLLAENQHNIILQIESNRGTIYDRNMHPLALNLGAGSVYAVPHEIKDKRYVARKLSPLLSLKETLILQRLNKKSPFVWVKRKADFEEASKVSECKLKGIGVMKETKRFYPNGHFASQVLGFVGIDNVGLEGLEAGFDSYLKGSPGASWVVRDAKARQILSKQSRFISPCDGYDLVLTIDEIIQHIVEKELDEVYKKFNAKSGCIIVMDPNNGDILALANRPTFNLNYFAKSNTNVRRNRAITDVFEPGSAFKIVTASAALENESVDLDDTFYCEKGAYRVADHVLHDHRPHGRLTFKEIIELSSNIGTVKVAQRLGKEGICRFIKSFGFGSKTNVELPGEVNGIVIPPKSWSKTSIATIPIGQGVAVTPLQLVNAISVIANGGVLVKPRIILEIRSKEGNVVKSYEPVVVRRVISGATSSLMKKILEGAVEHGTGTNAKLSEYRACGKTGTAQKIEPNGQYSHSKFVGSFIGFAPLENPRIAVLVSLDEPKPLYYGGSVAAPAFKKIAEEVLRYLRVEPDLKKEQWTQKTS